MKRVSQLSILSLGFWALAVLPSRAETLLYPSAQDKAIMVTGSGIVKTKASRAEVRLTIGEDFPLDASAPPTKPKPITEKELNSIVNALVQPGIRRDQITTKISTGAKGEEVVPGHGLLLITVDQPTPELFDRLLKSARTAVEAQNLSILDSQFSYSIGNCQALEQQAYEKAIQDAAWRAEAIAKATRQTLSPTPSVAEAFYNGFVGSCGESNLFDLLGMVKSGGDRPEVTVRKDLMVTYPVLR
jgi:Protein of unknown function (DUF541)